MEVIDAVLNRRSIRGFKPDPVPRKVLEEILEVCRWAPSSRNTQPWEIHVLGGEMMEKVNALLREKDKAKAEWKPDVPVPDLFEPYLQRSLEVRDSIDAHQFPPGTENLDEKRAEYWVKGMCFHYAPNAIIFSMDRALSPKAIMDIGVMAQTMALVALDYGLGTCIMARPVYWPDEVRGILGIPESRILVVAMAIGYPDPGDLVNSYPRHRVSREDFTHWYGV